MAQYRQRVHISLALVDKQDQELIQKLTAVGIFPSKAA